MISAPVVDERVCLVRVGGRVVGFLGRECQGVVPYDFLTPVPQAPEWIAGVANFRGRVLPLLQLDQRLGDESVDPTGLALVLVSGTTEAALAIQEVLAFAPLIEHAVKPPEGLDGRFRPYARARLIPVEEAETGEAGSERDVMLVHVGRLLKRLTCHPL